MNLKDEEKCEKSIALLSSSFAFIGLSAQTTVMSHNFKHYFILLNSINIHYLKRSYLIFQKKMLTIVRKVSLCEL